MDVIVPCHTFCFCLDSATIIIYAYQEFWLFLVYVVLTISFLCLFHDLASTLGIALFIWASAFLNLQVDLALKKLEDVAATNFKYRLYHSIDI